MKVSRFSFRGRIKGLADVKAAELSVILRHPQSNIVLGRTNPLSPGNHFIVPLSFEAVMRLFRRSQEGLLDDRSAQPLSVNLLEGNRHISRSEVDVRFDDLLRGREFTIVAIPPKGEAERITPYVVTGTVLEEDGSPIGRALVQVRQRRISGWEVLGSMKTDRKGVYKIKYRIGRAHVPEGPGVPVDVVALKDASDTDEDAIASSELFCRPPAFLTVNLVRGNAEVREPSYYETVKTLIIPLLEDHPPESIDDQVLDFLVCATDLDLVTLTAFAAAHRFSRETGIQPEAFFALLMQGAPLSLSANLSTPEQDLRRHFSNAADQNTVPPWPDLDAIMAQFRRIAITRESSADQPNSIGELLAAARLSSDLPERFVTAFLERKGSFEDFWNGFKATLSNEEVEELGFTLTVGRFTGHLPLVKELQRMRVDGELSHARELARLTPNRWGELLRRRDVAGGEISAPDTFPGETPREKEEVFARTMARIFEDAFPTTAMVGRLADQGRLTHAASFLSAHPELDLTRMRAAQFLNENPPDPGQDSEAVRQELEIAQRLFNIVPRFDRDQTAGRLIDADVLSAHQLAALDREEMLHRHGERLSTPVALNVWRKARRVAATAATALLNYHPMFNRAMPAALGFEAILADTDPADLRELFGSMDYCVCSHCRSVLSPSAYLVNLLQFIERQSASGAAQRLFSRRPDITQIELSCKNTETPLPTIDLVNEILEREVAGFEPTSGNWPQTTWTAEELRAHPEHLLEPAYEELSDDVYPWAMPFNLFLEEARGYLSHLDVPLWEVLQVFGANLPSKPFAVSAERLGLTPLAARVIANTDAAHELNQYWGMTGGDWEERLQDAPTFFERSGIDLTTFEHLRQSRYIGSSGFFDIEFTRPCDLEDARINGLTPVPGEPTTRLSRIHRFCRLQRALEWSVFELDVAHRVLAAPAALPDGIEEGFIVAMARFQGLVAQFPNAERLELLGWFGDLPTRAAQDSDRSYFEKVFIEPGADSSESPLGAAVPPPIDEVRPEIQAALRLTEAQLERLLLFDSTRTEANSVHLGWMFRWTSLAKHLDTPLDQAILFAEISGIDPFGQTGIASFDDIEDYLNAWDRLARSKLTADELAYLLAHRLPPNRSAEDEDNPIANFLIDLIRSLQSVRSELAPLADPAAPPLEQLEQALNLVATADEVTELSEIIRQPPQGGAPAAIPETYSAFVDVELWQRIHSSFNGPDDTPESRAREVLTRLVAYLIHSRSESVAVQKLADFAGLPVALTARLATVLPSGGGTLLEEFVTPTNALVDAIDFDEDAERISQPNAAELLRDGDGDHPPLGQHFDAVLRLAKAARIVTDHELDETWLEWLLLNASDLALLDLTALPVAPVAANPQRFTEWARLERLRQLARLPYGPGLRDILTSIPNDQTSPSAATVEALATTAEWQTDQLSSLIQALDVDNQGLWRLDALEHLADAFRLAERIGVQPDRLVDWAAGLTNPDTAAAMARQIKAVVKAKYPPDRWPAIIGPLRDKLRERQRDALVAHILAEAGDLKDPEDLLGRFYIDTQISPCQLTSRVKQATLAVQLFVQRILMGMELIVELSSAATTHWQQVLKHYRVWEANRLLFLYPENWLDPEWRDDKTDIFIRFAEALQEDELTEQSAERAYLEYLEGLRKRSNLRVGGMHHEIVRDEETDAVLVNSIHVFAHTHAEPAKYFYRQRVANLFWTPWEHVPGQLPATGVLPYANRGRLYVFWPRFTEKAIEPTENDKDPPKKFLELRLSWLERGNDTWLEEKVSNRTFDASHFLDDVFLSGAPTGKARYHLTVQNKGNLFYVRAFFSYYNYFRSAPADANGYILRPLAWWRNTGCGDEFSANASSPSIDELLTYTISPITTTLESILVPYNTWHQGQRFGIFYASPINDSASAEVGLRLPYFDFRDDKHRFTPRIISTARFFELVTTQNSNSFSGYVLAFKPLFYRDRRRTLFIEPIPIPKTRVPRSVPGHPLLARDTYVAANDRRTIPLGHVESSMRLAESATAAAGSLVLPPVIYKIHPFYHPFVCEMASAVRIGGIDALLSAPQDSMLHRQLEDRKLLGSSGPYIPDSEMVAKPYPLEEFDFSFGGAYSTYNWELFLHAPMHIAQELIAQRRFAEAQKWMHYVFNPLERLSGDGAARYWRVKPFFKEGQPASILEKLRALAGADTDEPDLVWKTAFEYLLSQVFPFKPHLLARFRVGAYMRWVVMRYLEMLIAWGDDLFRQDTMESLNEALQIYVLAAQILGPRPVELPEGEPAPLSYDEIRDSLDPTGNLLVRAENVVVGSGGDDPIVFNASETFRFGGMDEEDESEGAPVVELPLGMVTGEDEREGPDMNPFDDLIQEISEPDILYFCVPPNKELHKYWDIVADRLFKIRHCLNIEGVFRQLPLFAPPIDPGLLAQAAAAGVDIASALSDLSAPIPHYRFGPTLALAKEVVADVRALGGALQSALQARDGGALAELRASNEVQLMEQIRNVREQRIQESKEAIESLRKAREVTEGRKIDYENREKRISAEDKHFKQLSQVWKAQLIAGVHTTLASSFGTIPQFHIGYSGGMGPEFKVDFGGTHIAAVLRAVADGHNTAASVLGTQGSLSGMKGSEQRRQEEWDLQINQADLDLKRIDQDILTAEIREQIAKRELEDHDYQIEQSRSIQDYLETRFTNKELFKWLASELSRTYHQAYQFAYDLAKRAERCYQYEMGAPTAKFIQFGNWDNQRKGLLAGERLSAQLRRMEAAYQESHRREYELVKRVSVAMIDPLALQILRETGECNVEVPEALYELDHPGHYLRRIKSVAVSVPAVTGPYTNVSGKLSLTWSATRTSPDNYEDTEPVQDPVGGTVTIAISHGQSDSGMFETRHGDPRYLPFEGKGAISRWNLKLPEFRQFDYRTISDVVLEIRYTAREGGTGLANAVTSTLPERLANRNLLSEMGQGAMRMWSIKDAFPDAWHAFRVSPESGNRTFDFRFEPRHFPPPLRAGAEMMVNRIHLLVAVGGDTEISSISVTPPEGPAFTSALAQMEAFGAHIRVGSSDPDLQQPLGGTWRVEFSDAIADPDTVRDILVAVEFTQGAG